MSTSTISWSGRGLHRRSTGILNVATGTVASFRKRPPGRSPCRRQASPSGATPRVGADAASRLPAFDPAATRSAFRASTTPASRPGSLARNIRNRLTPQLHLLRALPHTERNVQKRAEAKDPAVIAAAKQYGEMYWDGPRAYGYGGYRDDGRWHPVARDVIAHFGLKPGMRVLDIGCGKGFLVKALLQGMPPASRRSASTFHSTRCCHICAPETHRLTCISAPPTSLPFPDGAFDCVLSLNTIHNLPRPRAVTAMREIQRLCGGRAFVAG